MSSNSNRPPNPRHPDLDGLRILVVEDHADSREVLVAILESFGATLLSAGTSHRAFELLKHGQPDLVVSDIGLPDEDGNSLMRRIRRLSIAQGGTTPAVAVTACTATEDRSRALSAGFNAFLVKPVDIDQLVNTIAGLTARAKWQSIRSD